MLLSLSIIYWVLSFRDAWLTSVSRTLLESPLMWRNSGLVMLTLGLLAVWACRHMGLPGLAATAAPGDWMRSVSIILSFLLITAGLFWLTFAAGPLPIFATTVMNILLAVLSLGMMREGLGSGTRAPFWWGLGDAHPPDFEPRLRIRDRSISKIA
jgi:hypothetical protein